MTANLRAMEINAGKRRIPFVLSPFDKALVEAEGWIELEDSPYRVW